MRSLRFVFLFSTLLSTMVLAQSASLSGISQSLANSAAARPDLATQAKIAQSYGSMPLSFEANRGQTDSRVRFLSRTSGYSLFLTGDEAVLALSEKKNKNIDKAKITSAAPMLRTGMAATKAGGVLRMKLRNANPAAKVTGVDELAGTSNYFIGNDPAKWRTSVPTYAKVKYEGIYSGIDLVYYGNQRQLEYDFVVAPGADPHRIAFDVTGAKRIRQDAQGALVFKVGDDEIRWHEPVVYQEKDGVRQKIAAHYAITDANRVGFELAKYDASRPLYIDPLIYSTYLGGTGGDVASSIAVDSAGNAYLMGYTNSPDFPTMNPLQSTYDGGSVDTFVTKINPAGSALVYSTYLGGSRDDYSFGIAVDSAGNAYVTGYTTSDDFPITQGAFQTVCNGGSNCSSDPDAFVSKINPEGSVLVYSTYLGGSNVDIPGGITVDGAGNAYVTGGTQSTDFPITPGAFQKKLNGATNVFVSKINPAGSALVYSTYLGGSVGDEARGIAVDSAGNVYVTGLTVSPDFPTKNPLQSTYGGGGSDVFVSKINPAGSALVYSTYLGGSLFDWSNGIALDSAGNAYISGGTESGNFPVTPGVFQPTCNGGSNRCRYKPDAFVAKLNAAGSALVYSTFLGGSGSEQGRGIAVDSAGNAYVTGSTSSANFPRAGALQKKYGGSYDAFVSKLNPAGSALVYSTYLGGTNTDYSYGIAVDSAGNAYIAGSTASTDFPVTSGAFQTICSGSCAYSGGDAFVAKLFIAAPTTTTLSSAPNPSTKGQAVTFTAVVTSALGAPPNGETVSFMKGTKVLGSGTLNGGSASFTISTLPVGTASIKAVYGGDSEFAGSTSNVVMQVVN